MDVQECVKRLDALFERGDMEAVEPFLIKSREQAEQEQDIGAQITILNEMMGFYRETSQYEKAKGCIRDALALLERAGLEDSLPHATTLLNAANALRAAGDYEQSMKDYNRVFAIFEGQVPQTDFRYAELYNNVALLYQELGRYDMASQCLRNALAIVSVLPEKEFQTAVTLTNLGSSQLREGKQEEATAHLQEAVRLFQSMQVSDTHLAAALSALGEAEFRAGRLGVSEAYYQQALEMIDAYIGKTDAYRRVEESLRQVQAAKKQTEQPQKTGRMLSRELYQECGAAMIHEKFPDYETRIAVGSVGEGSDRFGYDDAISQDHDFGAGFCLWLTDEDYEQIGSALQEAYQELVAGHTGEAIWTEHARNRFGVRRMHDFYRELTGCAEGPQTEADWLTAEEERLAAAVNGEVFRDDLGQFTAIRERIRAYYPERVWLLKLAQTAALFGQYGQYNYDRMARRQDWTAAALMREKAVESALHMAYLTNRSFCPHDKWLSRGLEGMPLCTGVSALCRQLVQTPLSDTAANHRLLEELAQELLEGLLERGVVYPHRTGDVLYLERYAAELADRAEWSVKSVGELAEEIARMEFRAFDEVKNEGGRADCQDDWNTFHIMRVSQYRTWNRDMLLRYRSDFQGAWSDGWNMITEKYGRMMASTAPEEYARLEEKLPPVSEEKRNIVEEIVRLQVACMEEFQKRYPRLAGNARAIHTSEDTVWNTSYETYLRGELLTYSDPMLMLYGRYLAAMLQAGQNPAEEIMRNTVLLYGYAGLEEAEAALGKA